LNSTIKEISKESFETLARSGYYPEYTNEEHIEFVCSIGGVKFSFYTFDEEIFGYGADFNLKEAPSASERERLEYVYMQTDAEEVVFENFHIDGTFVSLSSSFACGFYPEDFIKDSIRALLSTDGIISELKSKSYVYEPKALSYDPKVKEIVRRSYDILVERGYSPKRFDDEYQVFKFIIDGIVFYFMWREEDQVFAYCSEFDLKKKMSDKERERLEKLHAQSLPQGVTKEELRIDGKFACIMGEFARDLSAEDMMEISIREHTSTEGIFAELRAKSV
jgi:hypothetical protein